MTEDELQRAAYRLFPLGERVSSVDGRKHFVRIAQELLTQELTAHLTAATQAQRQALEDERADVAKKKKALEAENARHLASLRADLELKKRQAEENLTELEIARQRLETQLTEIRRVLAGGLQLLEAAENYVNWSNGDGDPDKQQELWQALKNAAVTWRQLKPKE